MLLHHIFLYFIRVISIAALLSTSNKFKHGSNKVIKEYTNSNSDGPKRVEVVEPEYDDKDDLRFQRTARSDISNQQQIEYIRQKPIQEYEVSNILLASDIEGSIHALNRDTGEKLWSLEGEGPLVQASTNFSLYTHDNEYEYHDDESNPDSDLLWMVEPYGDGNLFFFSKKLGLNKLPISISRLVFQSPFALNNDDKIYTGVRKSSLYSIDLSTGEIIQSYGSTCKNEQFVCDDSNYDCSNIVMIGKTSYELSIHSRSGMSWNVTYSTWGPNNIDLDLVEQNRYPLDGTYIAPFHDSTILAIDINSKIAKWVSQLPNTIVNVFDVLSDYDQLNRAHTFMTIPHPLKAPKGFNDNDNKGIYLDVTEKGSWYAMSSEYYPSLVQSAPTSRYSLSERYRTAAHNFQSMEDLRESIIGVHPLNNDDTPTKVSLGYPTNFPANPELIEGSAQFHTDTLEDEASRSRSSWLQLPSDPKSPYLRIDPGPSGPGFFDTVFGKFLFRCFENIMMLMVFGAIGYILLKMKWIPSLATLLKKNGLELKELEPVEVKIMNEPETIEDTKEEPKEFIGENEIREELKEEVDDDKTPEVESLEKPKKEVKIIEPEQTNNNNNSLKKRKRGSRGGKKTKKFNNDDREPSHSPQNSLTTIDETLPLVAVKQPVVPPTKQNSGLTLSDTVLGYGSYGTVVFKGTFQNRDVAVKRMLIDFYDVASQEINLLTESDDHSNVIRYFYSETNDKFLYIALELCSASLEDVIEKTNQHQELIGLMEPVNVLEQIAKGLHHLHSLKIVHRDIKPQNILVSPPKKLQSKTESKFSPVRILISDFGLCKKLEADESSFKATTQHAAGTSGWRAPELLLENINSTYSANSDQSFGASANSLSEALAYDYLTNRKLTRAIDIFSLGCVFYYILTNGSHPFGDRYLREGNVIKNMYSLDQLDILPDNVEEAKDLIRKMISRDPKQRPNTQQVLNHPYFWSTAKKLEFLLKVSDRFEVERRDPPSPLLNELEAVASNVIGNDWCCKFDKYFMDNLGKYRKYHGERLMDLLRALRNKYHHFNDLPDDLAAKMSPLPDGFYRYFNKRFPNLLMEIYEVVEENLKDDHILSTFF